MIVEDYQINSIIVSLTAWFFVVVENEHAEQEEKFDLSQSKNLCKYCV